MASSKKRLNPWARATFRYVILEWHAPHCSGNWVREWIQARKLRILKVESEFGRLNPAQVWDAEVGLVHWTNELPS